MKKENVIWDSHIGFKLYFLYLNTEYSHIDLASISGPEVIKLFSCSTQLSTKFQLLIKAKIPTKKMFHAFSLIRYCIYHANR